MIIRIILLFCVSIAIAESSLSKLSKEGFPAKISVIVRDQDGNLIEDADVRLSFTYANRDTPTLIYTKTDKNGVATGEEKTNNQIVISITKDGYYRSSYTYHVWKGSRGYETGRWEPWNPVIDATLFRKKEINKKRVNTCIVDNIVPTQTYYFDLLKKCVVSPKESEDFVYDFSFTTGGTYYQSDSKIDDDWIAIDRFVFSRSSDGIVEKEKNEHSVFAYTYEAPINGYAPEIEYKAEQKDKIFYPYKKYPQNAQYLIFRVSRQKSDGNILFYYGIIDSWRILKDWSTGKLRFSIRYRINTEPDDQNIEYYR